MTPPLWQKVKKNRRVSWWKWKRRVKNWLKAQHSENLDHGIQSHHFLGNRWGNNGSSERLYFLGLQNHCRWWLQPWNQKTLAPWKKNYDKPRQNIKKQRHYSANKVNLVKTMVFPVVMYECESWTIKKAGAFELWCWRRLLRVSWIARRSNQSILKEINPVYSLEDWCWSWNSNTGHLMGRPNSLEETWCS